MPEVESWNIAKLKYNPLGIAKGALDFLLAKGVDRIWAAGRVTIKAPPFGKLYRPGIVVFSEEEVYLFAHFMLRADRVLIVSYSAVSSLSLVQSSSVGGIAPTGSGAVLTRRLPPIKVTIEVFPKKAGEWTLTPPGVGGARSIFELFFHSLLLLPMPQAAKELEAFLGASISQAAAGVAAMVPPDEVERLVAILRDKTSPGQS
jgi:hypothetical protein